jgi:hypothetical protein
MMIKPDYYNRITFYLMPNRQNNNVQVVVVVNSYLLFILIYLLLAIIAFLFFVIYLYIHHEQYTIHEIHLLFIIVISCLLFPAIGCLVYLQCCIK